MREHIKFEIHLDIECSRVRPKIKIYVDEQFVFSRSLDSGSHVIKFEYTCDFGDHELRILRSGKTNKCSEQSVELKRVIIDGIDIRNIIWINSYNKNIWPEPWASQQREAGVVLEDPVIGETVFGHNCTWTLPFTSPFYKYVMEWLR
jgi:hypothetical protein